MDTNSQPNLVLGIDTGGTYTDGILRDYQPRKVLAAHKSLTTKRDFSIGIEQVIEDIQIEDPSAIRMVSPLIFFWTVRLMARWPSIRAWAWSTSRWPATTRTGC